MRAHQHHYYLSRYRSFTGNSVRRWLVSRELLTAYPRITFHAKPATGKAREVQEPVLSLLSAPLVL